MNLCSIHTSIQMRDKATLQPAQVQELSSNSVLQNLKPVLEADGKAGLIVYSTGFHDLIWLSALKDAGGNALFHLFIFSLLYRLIPLSRLKSVINKANMSDFVHNNNF